VDEIQGPDVLGVLPRNSAVESVEPQATVLQRSQGASEVKETRTLALYDMRQLPERKE
jgi:hypothetical protein